MAIVQISKIIHRTGANIDLPQLDVGELGYANDDRRLYIGDDSVLHPPASEGDTTQTELLTEHSMLSFNKVTGSGNTSLELNSVKTGQILVASGNSVLGNTWVNWDGNRIGPDNEKLSLGTPANIKISGGTPGMFLATDGNGNLTWTDSIGAVTIEGTPGGTGLGEIQFNTGNDFDANSSLTYDYINSVLSLDGNANVTGNIHGNLVGTLNGTIGEVTPNSGVFTTVVTVSTTQIGGDLSAANISTTGNLSVTSKTTTGDIDSAGTANVGNLIVTGNVSSSLIPEPTEQFDLGDNDNRWQSVYVSGAVYVGDHSLTQDGDNTVLSGNLLVDNADLGNSATANFFTGTLVTGAQPNITTVGNLTGLRVNGVTNLGNIANILISGGSNNFVLGTNGFGNLRWIPNSELMRKPAGSNTFIQFNDNGDFGGTANLVFDKTTGMMGVGSIFSAGNIQAQGNLTVSSMVSNSNISGSNIIASTRFTGSGVGLTNIPGGNVTGTVPNATTAVYAGTVTTGAQPNVTSVGTLSSLAVNGLLTVANITLSSGGTVSTTKFNTGTITSNLIPDADIISSLGNSTRRWRDLYLGGSVIASGNANIAGNIAAVGTITGASATFTTVAGSLTTHAQPNITSVGTLLGLTVTGLMSASYLQGDGSNIVNIPGANVQGEVSFAGIANSVDVANVSGLGDISTVNLVNDSTKVLKGDGTWETLSSPLVGNIASIDLNGDSSTVLKGDGSWETPSTTFNMGAYEMFANIDGVFFKNTDTNDVYSVALTLVP